jgi:hypothetical protein
MPRIETKSPPGPGSSLSAIVNDLIPVCLGGNNASPLNHWPQLISGESGTENKDALEHRAGSEICLIRDDALLTRYQTEFANDWVALCRRRSTRGFGAVAIEQLFRAAFWTFA